MNSINKKILLSGLVALFAFVTMIGATYAWFQVSSAVDVQSLTVNISSSESLLLLADNVADPYTMASDEAFLTNPTNYTTYLTNQNIIDAGYDFTGGRIKMAPITTINGIAFTNRAGAAVSKTPSLVTPGDYLEFSVWLFSQSSSVTITLYDYAAVATNLNTYANDVVNCLRVSMEISSSGTSLIYGVDKDLDFAFLPNIVGYDSGTPANNTINAGVKSTLLTYNGTFYKGTATPAVGEVTNVLGDASTLLTLTAGVPQKITMRIWLEGWDLDCDVNLLGALFNVAYGFSIKSVI